MQSETTTWRRSGDWKSRYSTLYSSRRNSIQKEEEPQRISFMNNDSTPYSELLLKLRSAQRESVASTSSELPSAYQIQSILEQQSAIFSSVKGSFYSQSLGELDTALLDMVRERSREVCDEAQDQPLDLPNDDVASEDLSNEPCVHGLSLRFTDRSVSRSRMSRVSTRRDMDIPSILAFTSSTPAPRPQSSALPDESVRRLSEAKPSISTSPAIAIAAKVHLEIPAFQKAAMPKSDEIPKWSIRRSVCPVCSQKWKDRSAINKIKSSGLKRNTFLELPSVIAPARLRTSIIMGSTRPPMAAVVSATSQGGLRNNSAAWQLTRARRFRPPKPQLPPPEARAPPSATAPLARKDLDSRVSKFLAT